MDAREIVDSIADAARLGGGSLSEVTAPDFANTALPVPPPRTSSDLLDSDLQMLRWMSASVSVLRSSSLHCLSNASFQLMKARQKLREDNGLKNGCKAVPVKTRRFGRHRLNRE